MGKISLARSFGYMPSPTRSVAIELAEHEAEITAKFFAGKTEAPVNQPAIGRETVAPRNSAQRKSPTESRSSEFPARTRRNSVAASQLPSQQTDLKTAADVYLDALLRLPAPARTEELMRIANLANVRLANGQWKGSEGQRDRITTDLLCGSPTIL